MQVEPLQRVIDDMQILAREPAQRPAMRGAPERDDLHDAEREIRRLLLQHRRHALRHAARGHGPDILPVEQDASRLRLVETVDQPQERGFARAIRAEHAEHASRGEIQADRMQDTVAPGDGVEGEPGGGGRRTAHGCTIPCIGPCAVMSARQRPPQSGSSAQIMLSECGFACCIWPSACESRGHRLPDA